MGAAYEDKPGGGARLAGASMTCGVCGATIETPARDLIVNGKVLQAGCVIDLDQHWGDVLAHYTSLHPEAELPVRLW